MLDVDDVPGGESPEVRRRRHMAMIGDLLRGLREEQGLTIDEVAAAAGLSVAWLRLLERGQRRTRTVTLYALAAAIGGDERAQVIYGELLQLAHEGGTLHGVGWCRRPKNPTPAIVRDAERLLRQAEDLVERLDELQRVDQIDVDGVDRSGAGRAARMLVEVRELLLAAPAVARGVDREGTC
jgi:transcriptional regulator with XRE-family HTH domain